ncbi:hypothetical protein [Paucibacter soli]|uniref:hypothetical protein n=1 Tax=Paucibacter soli TaxID=3133433 RepID=UPI0030A4A3E8
MHCPSSLHALNAAQHADPDSLYRKLVARPGLHFDPQLQLWIAAEAASVRALLDHPELGVRPPDEAVPLQLQGRAFGAVFARWLRMRDDAGHAGEKAALQLALAAWPPERVLQLAEATSRLAAQGGARHWQWACLPCSIAGLLGFALPDLAAQRALLQHLAHWAAALRPGASPQTLDAADAAVAALAPLDAQALALLWQSYEAGAGLLGNAWLTGATVEGTPPPIHHTRRFARTDMQMAGVTLPRGACVLLLLVAEPALGFGHGRHRCPGQDLALQIANIALRHAPPRPPGLQPGYLPLPNVRIPELPL